MFPEQPSDVSEVRPAGWWSSMPAGLMANLSSGAQQVCHALSSSVKGFFSNDKANQLDHVSIEFLPNDSCQLTTVPELFETHPKLAKYICPIGSCPIRDPVKDPHDGKIYERKNILKALADNPLSPCARQPLQPSMLIECPEEKKEIEDALAESAFLLDKFFKTTKFSPDSLQQEGSKSSRNSGSNS